MARRKGDFIVGVIARLVFTAVNGVKVTSRRVANGIMKQTEVTMKEGKVFRMASSLAGRHSANLKESLFGRVDLPVKNVLNGIIVQILRNCRLLWTRHNKSHNLHENFPLYTE